MKKLLTIAAIAAASTALAVESSNTFGILRVDSDQKRTVVAVPWVAPGGGNIDVANVVKTANLTNGDTLYYYDGSGFTMWELSDGAWTQAQNEQGETTTQPISRGKAIVLIRSNTSVPFYLYGEHASTATTMEISPGAMSLIAPTITTASGTYTPNDATWTNVNDGDRIIIQTSGVNVECKYVGETWKQGQWSAGPFKVWEWVDMTVTIPCGTGFWYKSVGTTAPTVDWEKSGNTQL